MTGWRGRALEIDLTTGQCITLPLDQNLLRNTLGGRGLAGYLLKSRLHDLATPAFCLAVGPLCGQGVETAERLVAVFRSPLTGGIFSESAGCDFASALKLAGFDAVLVKGVAVCLTQIRLERQGARLSDAQQLAGLNTSEALTAAGHPALVAGVAGEQQVRFASVVAGAGEPLARGGLGALWGEMRLKCLCAPLVSGPAQAGGENFEQAVADLQRLYRASPFLYGPLGIGHCGTAALLDLTQARRMLPSAYFERGTVAQPERLNASALKRRKGYASDPCPGCSIACRKQDDSGPLPEYDVLAHFCGLCGLTDLGTVVAAAQSCLELGLDPVSTAVTLAAFARLEERTLDSATILALIRQVARREGDVATLAEGSLRYLEERGSSNLARCAKGLELPGFDPRGAWGYALSLALSPAGDYRQAQMYHHELLRKPVPTQRFSLTGKARILVHSENQTAACDSLCLCRHTMIAAGLEEYAALLRVVTGFSFRAAELSACGERTLLRERWLNQQFGFDAEQDDIPACFFADAGDEEQLRGISRAEFVAERARYYRLRGLDRQGLAAQAPEEVR